MEHVILVDAHDNPVGTAEKLEAHRKGLLHRAISVLVTDEYGRVLLQKRALAKYHCGGLWTNTACTHPRPGETTQAAAERRLLEEMGLKLSLHKAFAFVYHAELGNGLVEHEYDHVYTGITEHPPNPNPAEAMAFKWMHPQALDAELESQPLMFTPWFRLLWPLARTEASSKPQGFTQPWPFGTNNSTNAKKA